MHYSNTHYCYYHKNFRKTCVRVYMFLIKSSLNIAHNKRCIDCINETFSFSEDLKKLTKEIQNRGISKNHRNSCSTVFYRKEFIHVGVHF